MKQFTKPFIPQISIFGAGIEAAVGNVSDSSRRTYFAETEWDFPVYKKITIKSATTEERLL